MGKKIKPKPKYKYMSVEVHDSVIKQENDFVSFQTAIKVCNGTKIFFVMSFNPGNVFSRWSLSSSKREAQRDSLRFVNRVLCVQFLGLSLMIELIGVSKKHQKMG